MDFIDALLQLVLASIPALVVFLLSRGKYRAEIVKLRSEAAAVIASAAGDLVDDLNQRLIALREERESLEGRVTQLEDTVEEQSATIVLLRTALSKAELSIKQLKDENATLRAVNRRLAQCISGLDASGGTEPLELLGGEETQGP